MKRSILAGLFLFSATFVSLGQENSIANFSLIKEKENYLLIEDSLTVVKDKNILVYVPTIGANDFMFVKPKKKKFSTKLIGQAAHVVSLGAAAVGYGSNNLNTVMTSVDVMNKSMAVQRGVDAIEKINELPISDKAKKIAGKEMKVVNYEFTEHGWVVYAELDKKQYEIRLQEAIITGEVRLLTTLSDL